ncbi:hypothetical protein DFJ74DRAFT_717199 [Hyaloraphidium curvatum]|nr:hypothetical protein DFJ74DRAFT_717199 [Hyaloraphidium curvatum]
MTDVVEGAAPSEPLPAAAAPVPPSALPLHAVVGYMPVYEALLSRLPPDALFRLARASKPMHAIVTAYAARAFDPDRAIARFFADPARFRATLAETGAIVSGSFPLQILGRVRYPGSDMDVYVLPPNARKLCAFVLSQKGYKYIASDRELVRFGSPQESLRGMLRAPEREWNDGLRGPELADFESYSENQVTKHILRFRRQGRDEDHEVQIIVPRGDVFATVIAFHSTCVMSILTHRNLFSLYPRTTFSRGANLDLHSGILIGFQYSKRHRAAIEKYRDRGFEVLKHAEETGELAIGPRRVGDGMTWTVRLAGAQGLPPDAIEGRAWELKGARVAGLVSTRTTDLAGTENWEAGEWGDEAEWGAIVDWEEDEETE